MKRIGEIQIDTSLCTACGACARDCVRRALRAEQGKPPVLDSEECFLCGHCIAICPTGAVSLDGPAQAEVLPYDSATFDLSPDVFLNAVKFRRSIRRFSPDPVDPALIARIIEAGRYTPTGSNKQNVSYIVLQEEADRLEMAALNDCEAERHPGGRQTWVEEYLPGAKLKQGRFFHGAKAVILIVSPDDINGALAACSMELMANALGLGVLYCGMYMRAVNRAPDLQAELGIKTPDKIVTCLCLGHTALQYHRTVPRSPADVIWR